MILTILSLILYLDGRIEVANRKIDQLDAEIRKHMATAKSLKPGPAQAAAKQRAARALKQKKMYAWGETCIGFGHSWGTKCCGGRVSPPPPPIVVQSTRHLFTHLVQVRESAGHVDESVVEYGADVHGHATAARHNRYGMCLFIPFLQCLMYPTVCCTDVCVTQSQVGAMKAATAEVKASYQALNIAEVEVRLHSSCLRFRFRQSALHLPVLSTVIGSNEQPSVFPPHPHHCIIHAHAQLSTNYPSNALSDSDSHSSPMPHVPPSSAGPFSPSSSSLPTSVHPSISCHP